MTTTVSTQNTAEATIVVSNASTRTDINNALKQMIAQRIKWQDGSYAASNAELYALLGQCLNFYALISKSNYLPSALNYFLDSQSISYNTGTSLSLKVIRAIFAAGGLEDKIAKRLFSYARVLKIAGDAGITGEQLPDFITEHHGIDELRRKNSDGETPSDRAKENFEYAQRALIETTQILLDSSFNLPRELEPVAGSKFSIALIRKNADGSGAIVHGTNNTVIIKAVLEQAGKMLKDDATKIVREQISQQSANQRGENMGEFNNEMAGISGSSDSSAMAA